MTAEAIPASRPAIGTASVEALPDLPAGQEALSRDPFPGSGAVAALMREVDWSMTPLGAPAGWSRSLLTTLDICLESRFPIVLFWGPDLTLLYNDGYLP